MAPDILNSMTGSGHMVSTLILVVYLIIFILCLFVCIWICGSLMHLVLGEAPFVPVRDYAVPQILEELSLTETSVLVEPGCGNGKILVAASKSFPNVEMIGIERNLVPYLLALWNTRNLHNVRIVRKDLFTYDFSRATHVFAYLFPKMMDDLQATIESQVAPGTILISCDFTFSKKPPVRVVDLKTSERKILAKTLYVYRF